MKLFLSRKPMVTPTPTLRKWCRDVIWPDYLGNDCSDYLCNGASEKKMINSFILVTEMTAWIAWPPSFDEIIFCQYSIVNHEPDKNLNLWGDFPLPNYLVRWTSITTGHSIIEWFHRKFHVLFKFPQNDIFWILKFDIIHISLNQIPTCLQVTSVINLNGMVVSYIDWAHVSRVLYCPSKM